MAGRLVTDLQIDAPDEIYQALIELHRDLSDEEIRIVDAKLILLLANHVGDRRIIEEAIAKARERPASGGGHPPNRG